MKRILIIGLIAAAFTPSCKLTDKTEEKTDVTADSTVVIENEASTWVNLLDSGTTAWHTYGKDSLGSAWKWEDSLLHLDASKKDDWQTKGGGDIVSNEEFENFDLTLDWKISEAGNSGIIIYVKEDTSKYPYTWSTGPEMQIADNEKNEDGKIHGHQAGDIYELFPSNSNAYVHPAGEWNSIEIVSKNGKFDLYMNGHHTLDTVIWNKAWKQNIAGTKFKDMPDFGTFQNGRIALQNHGADVWFRNVMIKRL